MNEYIDYIGRTDFTTTEISTDSRPGDYLYSKDSSDNLTLHRVPGILQLSSKAVGTCKKGGYVKKKFRPLVSELPDIMVPTNKRDKCDQFVLVDISLRYSSDVRQNHKELIGTVSAYLGAIDHQFDPIIMRRLATGHWKRKIDRSYQSSISDHDQMEADRIDYLGPLTISVDPDGCEDIDDAVSITEINSKNESEHDLYEIGIHIADPTSYIIENSDLDLEALNRSETVYLDQVSHMYPSELTSIFSLTQHEPSRAFSVIFRVSVSDGMKILDVKINKTMIRVDHNWSYDYFESNRFDHSDNSDHSDHLLGTLYEIGRSMYSDMVDRDTTLYDSKKMIQAFMVYANSIVADTLIKSESRQNVCPKIILRSQPRVEMHSNLDFTDQDPSLIELHQRMRWSSAIMKFYSGDQTDSHFGVGLQLYTHFTSPIRRYTDILIHRMLWNTIKSEKIFQLSVLKTEGSRDLQTLFTLNHNKRFYRRMINFERDWKIVHALGDTTDMSKPIRLTGRIIQIADTYLKVVIKQESDSVFQNMILRVDLMSKKMLESFENSNKKRTCFTSDIDNDQITNTAPLEYEKRNDTIVSIRRYDMDQSYCLFDQIEVSLVFVNGIRRFRAFLTLNSDPGL